MLIASYALHCVDGSCIHIISLSIHNCCENGVIVLDPSILHVTIFNLLHVFVVFLSAVLEECVLPGEFLKKRNISGVVNSFSLSQCIDATAFPFWEAPVSD